MKNLKKYFEDLFATPCNTTGMGNVSDTSGDMLALTEKPKKKKLKSLIQYLKDKQNK